MNIQIVDPVAWVKSSQARFFPAGKIDVTRLLAYLMSDVVELGGGDCHILRRPPWWFVLSNSDWLVHDTIAVRDLFQRVVPAPDHGEHSLRAEVLAYVYAVDVYTANDVEQIVIKGVAPPGDLPGSTIRERPGWRLVAFRLAP